LADLTQIESDIGVWSFHGGGFPVEVVDNGSDHRFKQSFNLICVHLKMWGDRENKGQNLEIFGPVTPMDAWLRPLTEQLYPPRCCMARCDL